MTTPHKRQGKCRHEWKVKDTKNDIYVPADFHNNGSQITGIHITSVFCIKCLEVRSL